MSALMEKYMKLTKAHSGPNKKKRGKREVNQEHDTFSWANMTLLPGKRTTYGISYGIPARSTKCLFHYQQTETNMNTFFKKKKMTGTLQDRAPLHESDKILALM